MAERHFIIACHFENFVVALGRLRSERMSLVRVGSEGCALSYTVRSRALVISVVAAVSAIGFVNIVAVEDCVGTLALVSWV